MRNFQTVLLVMLSLFLVSCFENETKVSSKQNVQEVMEQRQNMAATYARSLQLHAAATVDVLLDQASIQGDHVSNLSEAGTIAGLLDSGLIDSQAFAALDAGGDGALNTGRQRNMMQSGYCDGVLYTWVAGTVNDNGGVERPRLKGLGEAGLGSVAQVLSQHVGSNSYGMYKNNQLTTPSGVNVAIQCREMAAMIPAGSPVLFQEMASEFELARNGSYYEFENRACANADEDGFDRYRRLVTVAYNNQGDETGRETGEWDLFLESCHNMDAAERISVNLSSSTADQIDFSAQNLDGGSTRSVVCFEANTTKKDAEGEAQDVEQGTSFNNCQSATEFETSLADDIDVECSEDVVRTEEDTRACTGDGWTGTVTYEREIVMCTKNGNGNSIDYEKRGEWERTAVDCSKEEVATASCPFGSGLVSYDRTNKITNPETLAPTNPSWNYTGDNCVTGEISCIGGYAGNGVAFASTANGASNPPVPETTSLDTYCGSGSICEEQRSVSCDVGNKTQRRQYLCNGGWTSWGDHETAECDPGENLVCRYDYDGGDFGTRFFNFDQTCTYEENWGIEMYWDNAFVYRRTMPGMNETGDNEGYSLGELKDQRRGSNGCDSVTYYEICREQICEPNTLDQEQASCDSGYYGNKTRTRTCNEDGTEYGDWSAWNTSSCQAIICSPGATESQSQSCPSGYNGQATRTRTCNATGTGYGAWSAWDDSSCTSDGSMVCVYERPNSYVQKRQTYNGSEYSEFCPFSYVKDGVTVYSDVSPCDYPPSSGETGGYTLGVYKEVNSVNQSGGRVDHYLYYEICMEGGCSKRDKLIELLYGDQSEPVCTANATESQTQSCGSGYSGDQTRTRTCNGDGSAWGDWSDWDVSSCTIDGYVCEPYKLSIAQYGTIDDHSEYGYRLNVGTDSSHQSSFGNIAHVDTNSNVYEGHRVNGIYRDLDQDGNLEFFLQGDATGLVDRLSLEHYLEDGGLNATYHVDVSSADSHVYAPAYSETITIWESVPVGIREAFSYYGPAGNYVLNICQQSVCTPNTVESESSACSSGYSGTQTRTRTCSSDGTGYGSWSSWDTSGCTAQACTPYSVDTQSSSCPSGYSGNQTRSRTCNASGTAYGNWSSWDTSGCTAQSCTPGDPETQTQSCSSGYSGDQTRTRYCNASGTGYGNWSSWDTSGCTAQVCEPNTTESGSTSCGSGYSGNKSRTRTCNGDGTAYGSWSAWDDSTCTINVGASVNNSNPNVGQNFTLSWSAPAAEVCSIGPGVESDASPSGSTTLNESSSGSKTYTVTCYPHYTSSAQSNSASVTVNVEYAPANVNASASPSTVGSGDPYSISWSSNGEACQITGANNLYNLPSSGTRSFTASGYAYGGGYTYEVRCFANASTQEGQGSDYVSVTLGTCTPGNTDSESASCPSGQTGTQTRTRTCNGDGSAWGSWSNWDTSGCTSSGGGGSSCVGPSCDLNDSHQQQ